MTSRQCSARFPFFPTQLPHSNTRLRFPFYLCPFFFALRFLSLSPSLLYFLLNATNFFWLSFHQTLPVHAKHTLLQNFLAPARGSFVLEHTHSSSIPFVIILAVYTQPSSVICVLYIAQHTHDWFSVSSPNDKPMSFMNSKPMYNDDSPQPPVDTATHSPFESRIRMV